MMELTGEIADGAVLNYCVPPEYNDRGAGAAGKGREKGGPQRSMTSTGRS